MSNKYNYLSHFINRVCRTCASAGTYRSSLYYLPLHSCAGSPSTAAPKMTRLVSPAWTVPLGHNSSKIFLQDHYEGGYHRHPEDTCDSFAPDQILSSWYRLFFGISIALTALITLLLNLFVIVTLMISDNSGSNCQKTRKSDFRFRLRTNFSNTHLSFISLSISVILYSSICVPGMYLKTIDDQNKADFLIRVLIFGFYVSPIASSFMHLLMAFDR